MFLTPDPRYVKSDAIILRRTDYSETSYVVALLTREQGVMHGLAKGARRPKSIFEGEIDLLTRGQATILVRPRTGLHLLTEFSCRERYLALRKSADSTTAALYAAEVAADASPEGEGQPEIYDLLSQTLTRLAEGDTVAALAFFQVHLLKLSGYMPNLGECAVCGAKIEGAQVVFSFIHSGPTCAQCSSEEDRCTTISRAAVSVIEGLARMPASGAARVRIPAALARETVTFLADAIAAAFEREPRMLRPLMKAMARRKA
jgi:DNA repair protein RecO (recombination protein O)